MKNLQFIFTGKLSTLFQVGVVAGMSSSYIIGLFQPEKLSIAGAFSLVCYQWVALHTLCMLTFVCSSNKMDFLFRNVEYVNKNDNVDRSLLYYKEEVVQINLINLIRETNACHKIKYNVIIVLVIIGAIEIFI